MGTVSQLRPAAAVFDARMAAAACESHLTAIALLAGLAIIQITGPDGRADVTCGDLARRVGLSRPSMVRGLRAMEERGLGARPRTSGGKVLPVFVWALDRLPSMLVARAAEPAAEVQRTPRELWQEIFKARYRERFARETAAGRVSGVAPVAWPKEAGWEVLCEWSARCSAELGIDERRIIECACDAFFSFGDSVDVKLRKEGHLLWFAPRLIKQIDQAVVSRLTVRRPSVRKSEAEPAINDGAEPPPIPSMEDVERMIAEAAARKAL